MSSGLMVSDSKKLRTWFDAPSIREGIKNALGGTMEASNFISQMLIAFQDEKVADCTDASKFEAAHVCATLGLLPSLGQVALIARNMKDKGKCCTVMPQWQGFQALMLRNPDVLGVKAVLVHANDKYSFDPETERITHQYDPFDPDRKWRDFDDVRGGYVVVTYTDGRPKLYHYVSVDVMRKARACAQADNIWKAWFYEQCLKTCYRNAYARRVVPIDPFCNNRLQLLVNAEDDALGNDPNRVIVSEAVARVEHEPVIVEAPKASRAEKAASKVKATVKAEEPPVEAETEKPSQFDFFMAKVDKCKTRKELTDVYELINATPDWTTEEVDALSSAMDAKEAELSQG